jgi:transposase
VVLARRLLKGRESPDLFSPRSNTYMAFRDELGTVFTDEDFASLFPSRGRPAETPWRLALVTVFQFGEGLSDRRAADAVRKRIDYKRITNYTLSFRRVALASQQLDSPRSPG